MRVSITSIGCSVPPLSLGNAELAARLGVSEEWLFARSGIRERRVGTGGVSDLIVTAATQCLAQRQLDADAVDCIVVATITPDYIVPSTAAIVQRKLGARCAWGFDLSAACSGFTYALPTAEALVRAGRAERVLLCAADRMSHLTNPDDRATAVLFGDAATAVLLERVPESEGGIIDVACRTAAADERLLYVPAGGSARPASPDTVRRREHYLVQNGPAVFRSAVERMTDITAEVLARNDLSAADIDWFVPHQSNRRIIDAVARRLGLPPGKVACNIECRGNTSSASIPLCLSELHQSGKLWSGARVVLASFGAGFTTAAVYLQWTIASIPSAAAQLQKQSAAGRS